MTGISSRNGVPRRPGRLASLGRNPVTPIRADKRKTEKTLDHTIIYDCEYLMIDGAMRRYWCGPDDPDPIIAQIGAVKLGLSGDFQVQDTLRLYITPRDRRGQPCPLDPAFTALTEITQTHIDTEGLPLQDALAALERFSDSARMWSWGKDELNMVAISCYVAGIAPPIPATRFDNACKLAKAAGMPVRDIETTPSNAIAGYFGVATPKARSHDALDDALSISLALQHLLRNDRLSRRDFETG